VMPSRRSALEQLRRFLVPDRPYVHETTPDNARLIMQQGFSMPPEGTFFNLDDASYSQGGYGGAQVRAMLDLPDNRVLDTMKLDEDLLLEIDSALSDYARQRQYDAWIDDLQIGVLNPEVIKILE